LTDEKTQTFVVRRARTDELFDLRRRVLRADHPERSVQDSRDDEATSLHFAGILDGRVVASASWFPSVAPINPDLVSFQLRYMAIDYDVQGRGYGTVVVETALNQLGDGGAEQVWANARDTALGFYLATGWLAIAGSEHLSPETQLPHTVIYRELVGRTPSNVRNA
jgi:GNAT superfamily N-acetyltransferase